MKFLLRSFLMICIIAIIAACYVAWEGRKFLTTPAQSPGAEVIFDVKSGTAFSEVVKNLKKKELISDEFKFTLLARYKKLDKQIKAGKFILNTGWLPEKTLEYLIEGKSILHRITIREGLTWWETGALLEQNGFVRFEDFKSIITNEEFLKKNGIPFKNAEGFLMPETYLLRKDDVPNLNSARVIASRLVNTFWQKMKPYWPKKPNAKELEHIVILASIVEKETGIAKERARVAGVYANRLRIKMPLQADPTIIYGLGPSFDRNLRRVHLNDAKNIYNTYQHPGLPPGPICSPGVAALAAAIKPEKHDFLYFVAITDGGEHAFSKNLRDHQNAVRRYLINRRKQKQ